VKALLLSMALVAGAGMAQVAVAMPIQGIPAHQEPQGMRVPPHHGIHGIIIRHHPIYGHPVYGHRVPHRPYHPIHGIIIHPGVVVHHPVGVAGPVHGIGPVHGVTTHGIPVDPAVGAAERR
jgi:hypothetical protein